MVASSAVGSSKVFVATSLVARRLRRADSKSAGSKNRSRMTTNASSASSSFQMGNDTLRIDFELHRENRLRLAQAMEEKKKKSNAMKHNVVLLESGKQTQRYGTDNEPLFRQESYSTGCLGVARAIVSERSTSSKKKLFCSSPGYRTSTSFGWGNHSRRRS